MKKYFLFFLFLYTSLNAQVYLDTISNRYVAPGIIYTKISAPLIPCAVYVLKVDLKNPALSLETVKSQDKYYGSETPSSMAARNNSAGHFVVGAVNGDNYTIGTGVVSNMQISKGEILRTPRHNTVIGFDANKTPMMDFITFDGTVLTKNNTAKIANINQPRTTDALMFYNRFQGGTTGTTTDGAEVLINPLQAWSANDTLKFVVEAVETGKGNMTIPAGKAVLSGNGTGAAFIANNLHLGDTIKLYMGVLPGLAKMKELIGAQPRVVKDGVNFAEKAILAENGSDTYIRDPRTALGFSKDSSYLYVIVIDGRSGVSDGVTCLELADIMVELGVYQGVNMDGGGSSVMVLRSKIVNIPSDGAERPVGNSFLVVSSASTTTGSLVKFALGVHSRRIYKGDKVTFDVYGYDANNNPVTIDSTQLQFTASPAAGTIDAKGLLTAASKAGAGYIYVKYGAYTDSALITIKSIAKIDVNPKAIVVDDKKTYQLTMNAYDMDNVKRGLALNGVSWKSANPNIAAVDSNGVVTGKAEGKVKIIAQFENSTTDTISVEVQIGTGLKQIADFESLDNWSRTGNNIDLASSLISISNLYKSSGSSSLKIDYKFTYDPSVGNYIYLDTNIPVYGVPDSLFVDAMSDSTAHKLFIVLATPSGEKFRVNASAALNSYGKFGALPIPMRNFAALGSGSFYYPATITRIEIQLQYNNSKRVAGQTYTGSIYLDNLRAKYPAGASLADYENNMLNSYSLKQNYPNPFNPSTVIEFTLSSNENVSLKIFDVLGREVATLLNERLSQGAHRVIWNAGNVTSGVYFYRLQTGNFTETKKMLLIR